MYFDSEFKIVFLCSDCEPFHKTIRQTGIRSGGYLFTLILSGLLLNGY
jgi:hypothetical protein